MDSFNTGSEITKESEREKAFQIRLRESFVKSNRGVFEEIVSNIKSGEIVTAHRLAHTLKGNAGLIEKNKLFRAAETVEKQLKTGTVPGDEDMHSLQTELNKVLEELTPLEEKLKNTSCTNVIDKEKEKELFDKLEPMLRDRNTECEDLLDELRAVQGADELVHQIEEYDFKPALKTLERLKAERWGMYGR